MGAKNSKEEIIIAQAGNSGGQTNEGKNNGHQVYNIAEILGIIAFIALLFIIVWACCFCAKRKIGAEDKARYFQEPFDNDLKIISLQLRAGEFCASEKRAIGCEAAKKMDACGKRRTKQ